MRFSVAAGASCAVLLITACDQSDPDTGAVTSESKLASCDRSGTIVARSLDGRCTDVSGEHGHWAAAPLFADAPPDTGYCRYTWSSTKAPADSEALYPRVMLDTWTDGCASPAPDADAGFLVPYLAPDIPVFGPEGGAIGCDVCGVLKFDRIWLVLPVIGVGARQVDVKLSDKTQRTFKIEAPASQRWMSLDLPPLPEGKHYVEGPVKVR